MTIILTTEQLRALDSREDEHPRLIDPRTNAAYVLLSESEYATVREMLEEERQQESIHEIARRNAIGRAI